MAEDKHPGEKHSGEEPTVAPSALAGTNVAQRSALSAVPTASEHPERWGRVDTDGTVYVRTSNGERAVGSWQAGTPQEGLAHYARRFDDLSTEVSLVQARLSSRTGDMKQALATVKQLQDGLAEAAVVGDLEALTAALLDAQAQAEQAINEAKIEREAVRAQAVARKEALVAEAEQLANEATNWKQSGDRLHAMLDEWKTIRGVDRKVDEQLWRRFSKARDAFARRRGAHFAERDRQRATAKERKEEIVVEAEQLRESTDWTETASRFRELMTEWKAAGHAAKDTEDALWQRFRTAQNDFFARRSSQFAQRDAEFTENTRKKEELLAEIENTDPAADLDAARSALQRVQQRWDQVGKVSKDRIRELEGRLRAAEQRIRDASEAEWRRTDPEAQARVAQFRERVTQFEAQAAKARQAGDTRRADQAEAQAAQWREWLTAAEQAVANR